MLAAPTPVRRPTWVFFLVGLVLLASSQYALRDPRSQALPLGFLPGADICTFPSGASHSQPTPSPTHTHQPHCPLCVMGGFSDGVVPLVSLSLPTPQPGASPRPLEAPKPHIQTTFPLLNRGPPPLG